MINTQNPGHAKKQWKNKTRPITLLMSLIFHRLLDTFRPDNPGGSQTSCWKSEGSFQKKLRDSVIILRLLEMNLSYKISGKIRRLTFCNFYEWNKNWMWRGRQDVLAGRYYLHGELRTEIPSDSNGSNHPLTLLALHTPNTRFGPKLFSNERNFYCSNFLLLHFVL